MQRYACPLTLHNTLHLVFICTTYCLVESKLNRPNENQTHFKCYAICD